MTDLGRIEEVARAATQGSWEWHTSNSSPRLVSVTIRGTRDVAWASASPGYGICIDKQDAAHIATMDPPTTLALIAELRALREALKPFAEEARRWERFHGDDADDSFAIEIRPHRDDDDEDGAAFDMGHLRAAQNVLDSAIGRNEEAMALLRGLKNDR